MNQKVRVILNNSAITFVNFFALTLLGLALHFISDKSSVVIFSILPIMIVMGLSRGLWARPCSCCDKIVRKENTVCEECAKN